MIWRVVLVSLVLGVALGRVPLKGTAQAERGLHDGSYLSPSWGYMVRWYGDDWQVTDETSENSHDSLWLADSVGNIVGFDGIPGYGGDASLCLDDLVASVEAIEGVSDIAAVRDADYNLESHRDPLWSWLLLLARIPGDTGVVDNAIYLDCRMLAPGEAVLARVLAGPAATFEDGWNRYDVLHATLPRGAWDMDPGGGYLTLGSSLDGNWSRFFDQNCGAFPRQGSALFDANGAERMMVSVVDGQPANIFAPLGADWARILLIENTGTTPLSFDPAAITLSTTLMDETESQTPVSAVWEDTGAGGGRSLAPGDWAVLAVTVPAAAEMLPEDVARTGTRLLYQSGELRDGEAQLDWFGGAGGCGGGSRPRLRLSR